VGVGGKGSSGSLALEAIAMRSNHSISWAAGAPAAAAAAPNTPRRRSTA